MSISLSRKTVVLAFLVSLFVVAAFADDPHCPCIPVGQLWSATAYHTWSEAISAVVLSNGDPKTFALPTRSSDYPWIVVRRTGAEGGMISSPDMQPFDVEPYQSTAGASARFDALDGNLAPMMITTGDGNVLVIHLHETISRIRAARH